MKSPQQRVVEYLRVHPASPWHWVDGGSVLAWKDGGTILFRSELRGLLERLGPEPPPAFGQLVLVLGACRGRLPALLDLLQVDAEGGVRQVVTSLVAKAQEASTLLDPLIRFRAAVEAAGGPTTVRATAVEVVFERSPRLRLANPALLLEAIDGDLPEDGLISPLAPRIATDLRALREALEAVEAGQLASRVQTVLGKVPDPGAVVGRVALPMRELVRTMIEAIGDDAEWGVVRQVARELMAGMRLPRRLYPAGMALLEGVSGVGPRGTPDRLLVSELANDPLVMALRVSMNEALYLQREPPAAGLQTGVEVLMDTGLACWGLPRVLVLGVGLALVAGLGGREPALLWGASEAGLLEVDPTSREGLASFLDSRNASMHPGPAVRALAVRMAAQPGARCVVVTESSVAIDPAFVEGLRELEGREAYLALVDRTGRCELHRLPLARREVVCATTLDIDALLSAESDRRAVRQTVATEQPAILGERVFPFLMPVAGKIGNWCLDDEGRIVAVVGNRQVIRYRDTGRGAEHHASTLPAGRTLWMQARGGVVELLKAQTRHRPPRFIRLDWAEPGAEELELSTEGFPAGLAGAWVDGMVLVVLHASGGAAYSLEDGRLVGNRTGLRTILGRFYRTNSGQVVGLSWDGSTLREDPLLLPPAWRAADVLTVIERTKACALWVVRRDGIFRELNRGDELTPRDLWTPAAEFPGVHVPPDHRSVEWMQKQDGRLVRVVLDLETRQVRVHPWGQSRSLAPDVAPRQPPSRNVIRLVDAVGTAEGRLVIQGRLGRRRALVMGTQLRLVDIGLEPVLEQVRQFSGRGDSRPEGFMLERVDWPGGSTAWLDSRGLLHLRGAEPGAIEVSVVLAEGEVAWWISDGANGGPDFFLRERFAGSVAGAHEGIEAFLRTL